jgi:hypothetical protein
VPAFPDLLQVHLPLEPFVRQALRLLEADFRERALLALADWDSTGLVALELFREAAALPRPSWGRWNGLLRALREARKSVLRGGAAGRSRPCRWNG